MSTKKRLREENPEALNNPEIETLADQADQIHAIKVMAQTEGGEVLLQLTLSDVVNTVNELAANYKKYSHTDLIAVCATLSAHYNMARLLAGAEANEKALQEILADALLE